MEEIATQNLAILTERWPTLARKIRLAQPPGQIQWVTAGRDPALEVTGLRLWSAYDPVAEASIQASMIPLDSPAGWIYGVGGGDLIRGLLERQAVQRLTVIPLNLGLFHFLLHALDHRDWLSDPRVQLLDPEHEQDVQRPFAAVPACLSNADSRVRPLRDRIGNALLEPYETERLSQRAPMRKRQIAQNLALIQNDGDVASLFGASPGCTAFVAIAGPTLRKTAPWITTHTNDGILIAVDGALTPLLEMGLVPEIVVSMDDNRKSVIRYFSGDLTDCVNSTLVYSPIVHNDVLRLWPGPRLAMYTQEPIYDDLKQQYPRGELLASGSVSNSAVDLAVRMGATRVVLFGADFGFPDNEIHANKDAPTDFYANSARSGATAINGHGDSIATLASFNGFRIGLERYIRTKPQVRFINTSKEGARIDGAEYVREGEL